MQYMAINLNLERPLIMGIINLDSASFSSTGRCESLDDVLETVERYQAEGVDIIDIGAEPTNPPLAKRNTKAQSTYASDELSRLLPIVERVRAVCDVPISIDTSDPKVMQAVIELGVNIINDVRAFEKPGAMDVVAQSDVTLCLMHMLQHNVQEPVNKPYDETTVVDFVYAYLESRIKACLDAGIPRRRLIADPGFGGGAFGKNLAENAALIHGLSRMKGLNLPLLVGLSHKTMIHEALGLPVNERVMPSVALAVMAIERGANIVRVHDVLATRRAIDMAYAILSSGTSCYDGTT